MFKHSRLIPFILLLSAILACNIPFIDDGRSASLSELRNVVQSKGDANAAFKPATDGDKIISNGSVKTGTDSRVRLSITDGTIIRLGDNSEFVLRELSSTSNDPITSITLLSGKMWVAVTSALGNGKFDVQTPVGTASVRGSFMSVEYFPNGQMISSCLEGRCRLVSGNGKGVDLKTGEQSEVPGPNLDPTPPKAIDQKQIADWRSIFPESAPYVATVIPGPLPTATKLGAGAPVVISTPLKGATVIPPVGAVGQTACDHPYFPLRPGATWAYATEGSTMTWTVTGVKGDKNNATADVTFQISQVQMTQSIQCSSSNGILVGILIGLNVAGGNMTMSRSNATGAFLPPADQLKPGFSWNSSSDIQIQSSMGGTNLTGNGKITERYTVGSNNKVTVAGKSYDGLQVNGTMNQDMSFNIPGSTASNFSSTMNMVFAKGVGLVQSSAQADGHTSTTNLTSFNVP